MNCTFYRNYSDNRQVRKNISSVAQVSCEIKDASNLSAPTIIISKEHFGTIANTNYAYLDIFGRYYYIKDIRLMTAQRVEIDMSVDVLMSFSNQIYNLSCVINRQEFLYSKKIVDSELPIRTERSVSYKKVGNFPFSKSIVLTVDGGQV